MKTLHKIILPVSLGALGLIIFNSCSVRIPKGAAAVKNFDAKNTSADGMKLPVLTIVLRKIWIMSLQNIQKIRMAPFR